eukprot:1304262-Rhodomonas_salina.1
MPNLAPGVRGHESPCANFRFEYLGRLLRPGAKMPRAAAALSTFLNAGFCTRPVLRVNLNFAQLSQHKPDPATLIRLSDEYY